MFELFYEQYVILLQEKSVIIQLWQQHLQTGIYYVKY